MFNVQGYGKKKISIKKLFKFNSHSISVIFTNRSYILHLGILGDLKCLPILYGVLSFHHPSVYVYTNIQLITKKKCFQKLLWTFKVLFTPCHFRCSYCCEFKPKFYSTIFTYYFVTNWNSSFFWWRTKMFDLNVNAIKVISLSLTHRTFYS